MYASPETQRHSDVQSVSLVPQGRTNRDISWQTAADRIKSYWALAFTPTCTYRSTFRCREGRPCIPDRSTVPARVHWCWMPDHGPHSPPRVLRIPPPAPSSPWHREEIMTYRHWKDSGRGRRVTDPQKEQLTSWIPIWYRRIIRQPPQTPWPPVSCPLSVGTEGGVPGTTVPHTPPVKTARHAKREHRVPQGLPASGTNGEQAARHPVVGSSDRGADSGRVARGAYTPPPPRSRKEKAHKEETQDRDATDAVPPRDAPPPPTYLFGG